MTSGKTSSAPDDVTFVFLDANVAEAATDAVIKVFEAVSDARPPWRRQLATHVARAVAQPVRARLAQRRVLEPCAKLESRTGPPARRPPSVRC